MHKLAKETMKNLTSPPERLESHTRNARNRRGLNKLGSAAEFAQRTGMTNHKQACIDLEKATQVIIQVLQCEASSNGKLCELIRRLEEKEAETGRGLAEQVESNQQMRVKMDELQKRLEEKDSSLSKAQQTVAILEDEVRRLHQQLQSQQCNFGRNHEVNEWLQDGKSQLKAEETEDKPRFPLQSDQLNVQVFEIKEEAQDDRCDGSQPDRTDPKTEETFTDEVMKTELLQEQENKPNIVPVLCSETDLSPTDPAPLSQFHRVSVVLVDCCRTQGLQDEIGDRDTEQPETRTGSSPSSSELPASPSISQTNTEQSNKYFCSVCGKTFPLWSRLRKHSCAHAGESPYSCSQCGKSFILRESLKQHQYTHTGERPYHCTQCGKTFTRVRSLRSHQRIHTGEKPYHCTQCDKSFGSWQNVRRHQRVHTGEKPYHCTQCDKSFAVKESLRHHQRIHTGERPYQCAQCVKTFTAPGGLRKHQRVHAREKPYPCTHCSKRFTHLKSLKQHQSIHTGDGTDHHTQCI